jgi:hypothetical protein
MTLPTSQQLADDARELLDDIIEATRHEGHVLPMRFANRKTAKALIQAGVIKEQVGTWGTTTCFGYVLVDALSA